MTEENLAPVVEVNHNHIWTANLEKISNAIKTKDFSYKNDDFISLDDYCSNGGYDLLKKLQEGISAETLVSEVLLQEPKDNITAIIINII